jgi:hypothetical protein
MKISNLSARLGKVFGAVPALAVASAIVAFAPAAQAVVVVSPAANVVVPVSSSGIYINVVTGATGPSSTVGWDVNPWGSGGLFVWSPSPGAGGIVSVGTALAALNVGSVVSAASTFATSGSAATVVNGWALNSSNNYFGFSFLNEANGLVHYGYGVMSVGAAFNTAGRSVVNLFYESQPGVAITVAAIPEPSTWAMMLAGLAAAGALVRRQQRSQA